jgi:hypothetical protein
MKHFQKFSLMLVGGLLLTGAAINANADEWNKKTFITTSQSIEVPGAILPPGRYVFKLLDSPSNRHIVQVLNERENHVYCTNLAIPKQRMDPADKTVLTFYEMPGGAPEPVHTWFYPGDLIGQEFVYPRSRMAEIRAAMNQGGKITVAQNQMQQTQAAAPPPPQEEQPKAEEPAAPSPAPPMEEPAPPPAPPEQPAPPPAMPHTSSNTIEIGALGLMCIALAITLRFANRRVGSGS